MFRRPHHRPDEQPLLRSCPLLDPGPAGSPATGSAGNGWSGCRVTGCGDIVAAYGFPPTGCHLGYGSPDIGGAEKGDGGRYAREIWLRPWNGIAAPIVRANRDARLEQIMKRKGLLLAVALVAATIISGCVVVPAGGYYYPYPEGYYSYRYYRPYPYYRHPGWYP